jgi:hypothetical protein
MFVKQQTGISSMDQSGLSLQASCHRTDPVCSFYFKLGFFGQECVNENGLSETSEGFQMAVKEHQEVCWVTPETQVLSFFQLKKSHLNVTYQEVLDADNLPEPVDKTLLNTS